jgi:hypothetical protein
VWGEVGKQDVQEWIAWLPGRYSAAYASDQFRALQQFFKWLAGEEGIPDPMAGLRPPRVPDKPVPVFAGDELPRLGRACAGRGFGGSAATPRSSRYSRRPGSGCRNWPGSAMTLLASGAVTWTTCGGGR